MDKDFFLGLIYNASLLLAMVLIFDLLTEKFEAKRPIVWKIVAGLFLSGVGLAVMLTNWELVKGVVFDTRSVLIGIMGLYFGWIPTLIVMIVTSIFRIYQGGAGVLMGVPVILVSGLVGLVWRAFRMNSLYKLSWIELYIFGLVVHVGMLLCTQLLPGDIRNVVLSQIWLPVMAIYPVATMTLGLLLSNRIKREYVKKELELSEDKYRTLVDQAADGVFVLDKEGNFLLANKKLCEMLGYSRDEIAKLNITDTYPPEERGMATKRLAELNEGEELKFSRKLLKKNGEVLLIEANAKKLTDGRLHSVVRDVTSREQAQEYLKESEEKFSKVFQSSPYIIIMTRAEDGKIVEVNDAFRRLAGYTRKEALENSSIGLNLWADIRDREAVLKEIMGGKIITNREYKFRKKSGEVLIGSFSAQIIKIKKVPYILAIVEDISKRIEDEEKLAKINSEVNTEKHKLEAILRDMGDAVFVTDSKKNIVLANRAMERLFGLTEREMLGKNIEEALTLSYESTGEKPTDLIKEVFEKRRLAKPVKKLVINNKSGVTVSVDGVASPIIDEKKNLIGTVWVLRDVSKERELQKMRTDFISMASHQLRTPLTGIKWFVELLGENVTKMSIDNIREYINKIGESSERMIDLVNDLLTTSRADSGKLTTYVESYPIKDVLQQAIDEQGRELLDKRIRVEGMEKLSKKLEINADIVQMTQVFGNLLNNAANFSPENSVIEVGVKEADGKIIVSIKDNGVGIPAGQQHKVFEKFFRADNVAKTIPGSGLGLYVAKSMVESHGGKIWFESKENLGTTFFVELPIKQTNDQNEEGDDRGG
jgi:PAS domain S-box-containing protein